MTRTRTLSTIVAAGTLGLLTLASSAAADDRCAPVSGFYEEHETSGADCTSPVGLCIVVDYHGDLTSTLTGQATSIVPSADTPTTSVLAFTSNSRFTGRVRGRRGTLDIRNAGAFRTAGSGSIVDLQTVIGGTGDLAGVSGEVRASGTFSPTTGGRSTYTGSLCRP